MPRNQSGFGRALALALPVFVGALAFVGMAAPQRATAQLNIAVEARVTLLARAYNTTAQQLFTTLAATPGNVVFSPYSIGTAMSMALVGARGDTASEMARVMSERMANEAIDTANAEMMAILRGYDHSADPPTCPPNTALKNGKCDGAPSRDGKCTFGVQPEGGRCVGEGTPPKSAKLLVANGLMLSKDGDSISADYADTLKTRYGADVFRSANLDDVNNWVSRHTEGRIPKLFDQLEATPAAILLNAVYFKARWASTFNPSRTADESFHLTPTQDVQVRMMNQRGNYALVSRGGYRAIRLPYQVADLGLIVVLPDDVGGVDAVVRRLGPNELTELFSALRNGQSGKPVALALPRFKTEYKADLVSAFQAAGMRKAFDDKVADFSGMTAKPLPPGSLYIGEIAHRAVIDVNEESTEAAAATGVGMVMASAAPVAPEMFKVDHPFLFYLVDDTTGAILFQGRISDPR
jgi:serpin B